LVFCFALGFLWNLLKKEEEGNRLQIFRFFGGWVWSEGKKKKKKRHEQIVSDHHGHPLVVIVSTRNKETLE
jgi:hypothetical protein